MFLLTDDVCMYVVCVFVVLPVVLMECGAVGSRRKKSDQIETQKTSPERVKHNKHLLYCI